jgi:hypothetical protein
VAPHDILGIANRLRHIGDGNALRQHPHEGMPETMMAGGSLKGLQA